MLRTCPNLQFRSNPLLRLSEFALLLPLQLLPFLPRPSRVCNWPFFLNLLRCAVVKVRFALSSDQTLKTIQSFKRVLSFSESYAVVHFRASFCVNFFPADSSTNPLRSPLPIPASLSLAAMDGCSMGAVSRIIDSDGSPIDLRFGVRVSTSAVSLERR